MKYTLLLIALLAFGLSACGKPKQALPEQEKANYEKLMNSEKGSEMKASKAFPRDARKMSTQYFTSQACR